MTPAKLFHVEAKYPVYFEKSPIRSGLGQSQALSDFENLFYLKSLESEKKLFFK